MSVLERNEQTGKIEYMCFMLRMLRVLASCNASLTIEAELIVSPLESQPRASLMLSLVKSELTEN